MNRLSNERYEEIKQVVANLFEAYEINSIPVDPFVLAKKMGVEVVPYSNLSLDFQLELLKTCENGFKFALENSFSGTTESFIAYNDYQSDERIRFTILHEIGHIVLEHQQESELAELEANFFAKFAIAPPMLVDIINPSDFTEIANVFGISNECASYSMAYYKKWKFYSSPTSYNYQIVDLFSIKNERGDLMLRIKKSA